MPIEAIGAIGAAGGEGVGGIYARRSAEMLGGSLLGEQAAATGAVDPGAGVRGLDFGAMLGGRLDSLAAMDGTTSSLAAQAATGDLENIHDYVIAAQEMQTATELTTTIRNKALEAFSEIMRMPL